ncbi:glycosyltransferase [Novosphingobium sp. Fuku2-ISO-50]|uniref:glycosyltransferase n=1 Tax=Novosphingobium sp. Fuku2-ISO-50 TaxID=1739114 RepID=UPI0018D24E30|nr:glycosyltransferase [Novosphingobium sp. Fuku2-ISO-50]
MTVIGATVFGDPKGNFRLKGQWSAIRLRQGQFVDVADGPLTHQLLVTGNTVRDAIATREEDQWHGHYNAILDTFKPDLVIFHGGRLVDMVIADEARVRGIPSAAYVANGNYGGSRWCRDVDLIFTESDATAQLYRDKARYRVTPVGTFVDPATVVASDQTRENLLLVNPSAEKGAGIVILLALALERRRPDIRFEVVQSRGNWQGLVKAVTTALGRPRDSLGNVIVTPNTDDMRPVYGRARLLLAPSLCWDSGPRVLAEAMLNGIPAIITDRGGLPEMVFDGGIVLKLPLQWHEAPYLAFPYPSRIERVVDAIIRLYDDEPHYQALARRARAAGRAVHDIEFNVQRLIRAFAPLLEQQAGDRDFYEALTTAHKQGLTPDVQFLPAGQAVAPLEPDLTDVAAQ